MDRLAVPVQGGDLLGPFRRREPAAARPVMPHPQARNLAFTDGLDGWQLHGGFLRDVSGSHWQDYSCTTEGRSAILTSAVPQPYRSAHLGQEILADTYRSHDIVFRGELRTEDIAEQARLYLWVTTDLPSRACHDHYSDTVTGSHHWARHQVAAQIPADAILVQFGVTLTGRGRVELRHAELTVLDDRQPRAAPIRAAKDLPDTPQRGLHPSPASHVRILS